MPKQWENIRRIDGDMFEAIDVSSSKTKSDKYANALRTYGIKARVIYIKSGGCYVVFTKDGKVISTKKLGIEL